MRLLALLSAIAIAVSLTAATAGWVAADDDEGNGNGRNNQLGAQPFIFIGSAADCGTAGSNIVTSAWLGGMGLPDNGSNNPDGSDSHRGLLLSKNGPTLNCAAAGATISGIRPGSTITELGFDYRVGGHCGAGAPRFNITTMTGLTYFAGCAGGTQSPAPQDPEWMRVRFTAAQIFPAAGTSPPFVLGPAGTGTQVRSISIVYDEGTDTPLASGDPSGVGLAVIDNIDINGKLITAGSGVADGTQGNRKPHRGGDEDNGDDRKGHRD